MTLVIVERELAESQALLEVRARQKRVASCFATQRVRFAGTYVSKDARYAACMYEAPDAEAVRVTQRTADVPVASVWSAHALLEEQVVAAAGYSLVVAQRQMPETTTIEYVKYLLTDPKGCRARFRIKLFGAYLSLDCRRMVCCYYSPDLESVRMSSRESGIPLERVWLADRFVPAG